MLDYGNVPFGYVSKFKFNYDKKSNWMDLSTKDLRNFKFKFEDAKAFQKAYDTVNQHVQIKKFKDFFAFDYAKKQSNSHIMLGDSQVLEIVMRDFKRMHL